MATVDVDEIKAKVEALVSGPTTLERWYELIGAIQPLYRLPGEELARAEAEVLAPMEAALDARWPAMVRQVNVDYGPKTKRLGRCLQLSFRGRDMQSFGLKHGLKHGLKTTKKMIAELIPLCLDGMSFEGFYISEQGQEHAALIEALCDLNGAPIKHLRWWQLDATDDKKQTARAQLEALADVIAGRCGQTLESLGADLNHMHGLDTRQEGLYGRLAERAHELAALRELRLPHAPHSGRDVLEQLLEAQGLEALEALTFTSGLDAARAKLLMEHEGARRLKRIGVGWFKNFNHGQGVDLRALVHAPNLSGVQVWDLRDSTKGEEWESEEAAIWHAERFGEASGRAASLLDEEVVDLMRLDAAQTREALFEGAGLRRSEAVKALRIKEVSDEDAAHILGHAHEAWPKLECLVFMREFPEPAQQDWIAASPLLGQLKYLMWKTFEDPYRYDARMNYRDKKAVKAARQAAIQRIFDPATHPFMAYKLWHGVMEEGLHKQPVREEVAKWIGLPGPYAQDYQLVRDCDAHVIARLGGRQRLLIDGPQHAETLDHTFVWPVA